jgi:hypothetical protein
MEFSSIISFEQQRVGFRQELGGSLSARDVLGWEHQLFMR